MEKIIAELERIGVPDRYGLIGGLRRKIAEMLVERAKAMGTDAFYKAGLRLLESVAETAKERSPEYDRTADSGQSK